MSAKMTKRKYISGAQKLINQQRKKHFNAKLPKISFIFLPNQREAAGNTGTGERDVSGVSTDATTSKVGAGAALLTDPPDIDKSRSHHPADDCHSSEKYYSGSNSNMYTLSNRQS